MEFPSPVGGTAPGSANWQRAARAARLRPACPRVRYVAENFPPDTEYLSVPDLVERWDLSPGKVHRLIEDHHLAAVRIDGVLQIPAEFAQGDEPLHSLRGTLLALLDAGFDNDEAVVWLLSENDELGERPISALIAGRKSAVRRATQGLAF